MALSCYNYSVINYNVIKKSRPMAQRDYSLDEKIVTAARDEFSSEKELHRLFDDSERISEDTVFAGKTMITKIGEDLRAKVQFVSTHISGQYDALRLTIINRHEGAVDTETFKFSDIIGMKGDRTPHIWDDNSRVGWFVYQPTPAEYNFISDMVEDYISMYADNEYYFGQGGMEMGGM